jgi:hypothetical protein
MKLTVQSTDGGLTRVESADDITAFDFTGGVNPFDALLGPQGYAGTVLLSLARSLYIDSSGVGWLIQSNGRFTKAGGRLIVHSIAPMVNHCFRVLGMYEVLNLAADEGAALKLVTVPQAGTA